MRQRNHAPARSAQESVLRVLMDAYTDDWPGWVTLAQIMERTERSRSQVLRAIQALQTRYPTHRGVGGELVEQFPRVEFRPGKDMKNIAQGPYRYHPALWRWVEDES